MGLDAVELIFAIEKRFAITIRNDEASTVRTVGDLVGLVQSRMAATRRAACPSLTAFLRVRRVLREARSNPTLRPRPSTPIAAVVPWGQRQKFWRVLRDTSHAWPPELRRPMWMRRTLVLVSCVAIGIGVFGSWRINPAVVPLGALSAAALIIVVHLATKWLRVCPPESMTTFGDVARWLVGCEASFGPIESDDQVFDGVGNAVVEVLDVRPNVVVPEARLIEDLGMG